MIFPEKLGCHILYKFQIGMPTWKTEEERATQTYHGAQTIMGLKIMYRKYYNDLLLLLLTNTYLYTHDEFSYPHPTPLTENLIGEDIALLKHQP